MERNSLLPTVINQARLFVVGSIILMLWMVMASYQAPIDKALQVESQNSIIKNPSSPLINCH